MSLVAALAIPARRPARTRRGSPTGCVALLLVMLVGAAVPPVGAAVPPPPTFADVVEQITPAVVNISTTKAVRRGGEEAPELPFPQPPPGSPFEDFFREFFDRDRSPEDMPRRTASLGSGFVVDRRGLRGHQQPRDRRGGGDLGGVRRRDHL